MEAKVYINGEIGVDFELIDLLAQKKKYENITSLQVVINSPGGFVDKGFEIYNYLRGLQIPITTIASGACASIASVIFLAGDSRRILEGTKFMIHAPKIKPEDFYSANELKAFSDSLAKIEKELVNVYTERTSLTEDEVKTLLQKDTYMNDDQLQTFGFINQTEPLQLQAVAKLNFNNSNIMTAEDKSWIETKLDAIAKMFASRAKALMLQDATGVTIEFPELGDGDNVKLGDQATVEGQPANGSYVMPSLDGVTVVFVDGAVTEIIESDGDSEIEALKKENEELKAQISANATAMAKALAEFKSFKAQIVSKMATAEPTDPKKTPEPVERSTSKLVENLKKLRK